MTWLCPELYRKSPEFNPSNDQNVIVSETVLKVKLVLPPSLEILEILNIVEFLARHLSLYQFDFY